uniref:Uncharacterized protein n=1 Tax=Anguilla anguilla TaxID=7936 RepID=A0A0E9U1Y0_ANGAN
MHYRYSKAKREDSWAHSRTRVNLQNGFFLGGKCKPHYLRAIQQGLPDIQFLNHNVQSSKYLYMSSS